MKRLPMFFVPFVIFYLIVALVVFPLPFRIRLAKGESMLPTESRSEALLVAWGETGLDVGDIVVYEVYGSRIAHRVVSLTRDAVIAKGDNNDFTEVVPWQNVLGKVVAHCPSFLFVIFFLASIVASVTGVIYELLEWRSQKIYK